MNSSRHCPPHRSEDETGDKSPLVVVSDVRRGSGWTAHVWAADYRSFAADPRGELVMALTRWGFKRAIRQALRRRLEAL